MSDYFETQKAETHVIDRIEVLRKYKGERVSIFGSSGGEGVLTEVSQTFSGAMLIGTVKLDSGPTTAANVDIVKILSKNEYLGNMTGLS